MGSDWRMVYPVSIFLRLLLLPLACNAIRLDNEQNYTRGESPDINQPPSLRFKSPLARQFSVPRRFPLTDFEIDDSYAGLLDISNRPSKTTKFFFWFIPCVNREKGVFCKDLSFWTNGGPGCSSLTGAFQEHGPISWLPGTSKPVKNLYSWHTRTSMLYFEHPAPVGYSEGNVVIQSEHQVADYTFRFLQAFLKVFEEMSGKHFYLMGESYAGHYISYIAEKIYAQHTQLALQLQGVLLVDVLFSSEDIQTNIPYYTYIEEHKDTFKFNASFMERLKTIDQKCGYAAYLQNNLKYPPMGPLPPLMKPKGQDCEIAREIWRAFPKDLSMYNILANRSLPDPLITRPVYLNRPDIRKALNVVSQQPWKQCVVRNPQSQVFPEGDKSQLPVYNFLPSVIAKSKRTIMTSGKLDARVLLEGSKLAIQNMTWNGCLGFRKPVNVDFRVDGKLLGRYRTERGLTFIEIDSSGHMVPRDEPKAAMIILEYLLGQRAEL